MAKKIELVKLPLSAFKNELGNPRKCSRKKLLELQESLDSLGDFGVIVIDDNHNIISGHQRAKAMQTLYGEDHVVDCKMLIGYSEPELKAINIKANTHAGEWDLSALADWTADLNIKLGLDAPVVDRDDIKNKYMEPVRFEKYNYVVVAFKSELDYLNFTRLVGLNGKRMIMAQKKKGPRTIAARAIWYDDLTEKVNITEK